MSITEIWKWDKQKDDLPLVSSFKELNPEHRHLAGGKGGTLAYFYQKGYPVPNGFIIMPAAFINDELISEAWTQVHMYLEQMRKDHNGISFAVRSSAQAEDSAMASFAGQFDTVLELQEDNELHKAIHTVRLSKHSEEKELGFPQDIEWAIAGGKLYLLQSRPVTTLVGHNPATGEWNDSITGCYLWSNVNFGEAMPEIMTPLTWTVQQHLYETWKVLPGYQSSGNIGGRIYLNLSIYASVLRALGKKKQGIIKFLEGLLYTRIPEDMEIPIIPLSKSSTISILLNLGATIIKQARAMRELPEPSPAKPCPAGGKNEGIY